MDKARKNKMEQWYAANKAGVDALAAYLDVPPMWVVALFDLESSLNPAAKNDTSGAIGLNQMMPSTLAGLGITPAQYVTGGVSYQLQVMQKFFKPIRKKVKRAGDLYLFNLYPIAIINNWAMDYPIGKDEDFTTRGGVSLNKIYDQNKGLDFNKDGKLTRRDVVELFESRYDELVTGNFFFKGPVDRPANLLAGMGTGTGCSNCNCVCSNKA